MKCALFHSPLVGPSTWRWVAVQLDAAGHDVVVPDLRGAAATGDPAVLITRAAAAVPEEWPEPLLVAHSGFGSLLPSVAEQVGGQNPRIMFVDAVLPPCQGTVTPSADFLEQLKVLAIDGVLPRWSTWWGDGAMAALVPDPERRVELGAEMPEVPLAFFESTYELPSGWCETEGWYVLLSESYRDDAERARAMGWPTIERPGGHLDIVNDAGGIAETIIGLAV